MGAPMSASTTVVIRPERSGYVFGCGFLLGTAILWVIAQAMYAIKSQNDMIIAWIGFPLLVLFGISILLGTALPKVTVDGDGVEVRDRLGRHRRFARSDVSHAAMRSIIAPSRYGWVGTNAFFLVGKDGRALVHLAQRDYDTRALEGLVETLGLAWPETKSSNVRQINKEFKGAFAFDFQTIAIAILFILAVAMAAILLAFWFR
jgi:uncharacterized protein DUF6560